MIVRTFRMYTSYFVHISRIFYFYFGGLHLNFSVQNAYIVSGLCNL